MNSVLFSFFVPLVRRWLGFRRRPAGWPVSAPLRERAAPPKLFSPARSPCLAASHPGPVGPGQISPSSLLPRAPHAGPRGPGAVPPFFLPDLRLLQRARALLSPSCSRRRRAAAVGGRGGAWCSSLVWSFPLPPGDGVGGRGTLLPPCEGLWPCADGGRGGTGPSSCLL